MAPNKIVGACLKKNNGEMLRYFLGHDRIDRTQDM